LFVSKKVTRNSCVGDIHPRATAVGKQSGGNQSLGLAAAVMHHGVSLDGCCTSSIVTYGELPRGQGVDRGLG
jgi:hypothetical protein